MTIQATMYWPEEWGEQAELRWGDWRVRGDVGDIRAMMIEINNMTHIMTTHHKEFMELAQAIVGFADRCAIAKTGFPVPRGTIPEE